MRYGSVVVLAVIGMLPSSLLPVMVTAAHGRLGFTIAQSASLGSAAILWTAIGALAIALIGVPARWKVGVAAALVTLCLLDLASMTVTVFAPLLAMRALHGFVGGLVTGVGYAAIGRAQAPDRLFGVLLALQFLLAGTAIAILPGLIATNGVWVLFAALAGAAGLTLCLVPVMPDVAVAATRPPTVFIERRPRAPLLWGLAALLLIEAGHTAGSAFMLDIARSHGMRLTTAQVIVGAGGMAGLIGATGAAILGARRGRTVPLVCAGVAGTGAAVLLLQASPIAFAAGASVGSIAWAWSIPLVLGGCVAIDPEGGGAIWLSFVAKLGLALGPMLGALVVSEDQFGPAILLSIGLGLAGLLLFLRLDRGGAAP